MDKPPRLVFRRSNSRPHVVVLAHGITQEASGLYDFADRLAGHAPDLDVAIFDYDWTQALASSGAQLAAQLGLLARHETISLVGYSMGGLVARFAVADHPLERVRTVVTLATPNRGALTPSQLGPLAQRTAEGGKRFISPLAHCPGVRQLSEVEPLVHARRRSPQVRAAVAAKRYASVPALYFHPERPWREAKTPMGRAGLALNVLSRTPRPHDGIVSEQTNNLVARRSTDFAEFDYARFDGRSPARCHVSHFAALELDHISVLGSDEIAALVASLVLTPDWRALHPDPDAQVFLD